MRLIRPVTRRAVMSCEIFALKRSNHHKHRSAYVKSVGEGDGFAYWKRSGSYYLSGFCSHAGKQPVWRAEQHRLKFNRLSSDSH